MPASPRVIKVARDLASHKFRTLLVVASIAVGIFAISVVMGGRGILLREFDAEFAASVAPTASFTTTDADAAVVRALERDSEVRIAEGRRQVSVRFREGAPDVTVASTGWDSMQLIALSDFEEIRVSRMTPETLSTWPPRTGEIVLERSIMQVADYAPGDVITVETPTGARTQLRVAGFVHDINAPPATFVALVTGFVTLDTMPLLDQPAEYNHIDIVAEDARTRADASRLASRLRDDVLGQRGVSVLQASVPEPGSHFLGDIFKAVSLLLLALGVLSLALSGFLVVTTVQALMAQHVRQIGIMKAIGGKASQISAMYFAMVVAYGVMAVLVGMPVGAAAGRWFTTFAANLLNFRVTSYEPPVYVVVLSVLVGVAVPVLAAAVPVLLGTRISVVRAFNATGMSATSFGHGLVDRALGLLRDLPRPVALSLRNTFLRKGRLALTLITLILASAVVMSVLTVRTSILATVDEVDVWNFDARLYLAVPKNALEIRRVAERTSGVTAVETVLEQRSALQRPDGTENESIDLIGVPPESPFVNAIITSGRWLEPTDTNAIVFNADVVKDEPQLRVGSIARMSLRGVEEEFRVVGHAAGGLMGPVAFVPLAHLDSLLQAGGSANRVFITTEYGHAQAQQRAGRALEAGLEDRGVPVAFMTTQLEQRDAVANQLGILVTFLAIMAVILAAVGVIGLTGTMTINVLESTREIGVMRAIGASHRSVFGIFITEGVVIAVIAWAVGAIVSWPMSWLLNTMLSGAMNLPLVYSFSWFGVAFWLVAVAIIAVLASLLPAYRASQVSVRDAIAYE